MLCKLCLKEKKLIKAHIYPEFFYKNLGLYVTDNKGRGRIQRVIIESDKIRYDKKGLPIGIYDHNILCLECDNYINEEFEVYSKRILFDEHIDSEMELGTFSNIDYTKFKLFMLSIFWRASISDKFSGIKLPDLDEEEIRLMLINKDAKEEDDYGVLLLYLNDPEITYEIITDVITINKENSKSYSFIIGGFIFCLSPDKSQLPLSMKNVLLKKNGILKILTYPKGSGKQKLNEFYNKKIF
jgi:hypothetical protein